MPGGTRWFAGVFRFSRSIGERVFVTRSPQRGEEIVGEPRFGAIPMSFTSGARRSSLIFAVTAAGAIARAHPFVDRIDLSIPENRRRGNRLGLDRRPELFPNE